MAIPSPILPAGTATTSAVTSTSTSQTLQQLQHASQAAGNNLLADYSAYLPLLEFVSVLITIGLVVGIVYFAIESGWWKVRKERFNDLVLKSNVGKKHAQEAWHHIQESFFRGSENDLKVAVMEADKLLNEALRDAGVMGFQLGDRLKKANPSEVPNLNDLWQAHKLRNQIAHEPNFKLKRDLAERAIKIYEEALKNLGIFDDASAGGSSH
jgi:hypothetical protein